jgi:hypothetical protein
MSQLQESNLTNYTYILNIIKDINSLLDIIEFFNERFTEAPLDSYIATFDIRQPDEAKKGFTYGKKKLMNSYEFKIKFREMEKFSEFKPIGSNTHRSNANKTKTKNEILSELGITTKIDSMEKCLKLLITSIMWQRGINLYGSAIIKQIYDSLIGNLPVYHVIIEDDDDEETKAKKNNYRIFLTENGLSKDHKQMQFLIHLMNKIYLLMGRDVSKNYTLQQGKIKGYAWYLNEAPMPSPENNLLGYLFYISGFLLGRWLKRSDYSNGKFLINALKKAGKNINSTNETYLEGINNVKINRNTQYNQNKNNKNPYITNFEKTQKLIRNTP